ncbi:hypothetical protein [Streptomyces sp. RFCAC02]|uniref:hypothetical protein n=1 Tax=Streptomyces sp. RFCAC02 TaxID=2499143 RepID=UPI00143D0D62|nr:hypothetical protein [Streptomyces sp. RFCAC02]
MATIDPVPRPAPVRDEDPRITVITGLEGPVMPLGSALPDTPADEDTDGPGTAS